MQKGGPRTVHSFRFPFQSCSTLAPLTCIILPMQQQQQRQQQKQQQAVRVAKPRLHPLAAPADAAADTEWTVAKEHLRCLGEGPQAGEAVREDLWRYFMPGGVQTEGECPFSSG